MEPRHLLHYLIMILEGDVGIFRVGPDKTSIQGSVKLGGG
jgi:hypothetical protein